MKEKKRKILKTSATRWLSHQKCIERILDNWDVLLEFFKHASINDKLKSAQIILTELTNECNKAYLYFLKYVLSFFNELNALFQAKKPLIHTLYLESTKIFFKLGQNFIKKTELKTDCNVRSPHISLPVDEIYLGPECLELLKKLSKVAADQIKLDCFSFYISALEEIQQRLPIQSNSLFKDICFLDPKIVLGVHTEFDRSAVSFKNISEKFKCNLNDLLVEWRSIEFHFLEQEKKVLENMGIEEFWTKIQNMKNFNNEAVFINLSKLAKHCLVLPHANADAERIFSIVTDVRSKKKE